MDQIQAHTQYKAEAHTNIVYYKKMNTIIRKSIIYSLYTVWQECLMCSGWPNQVFSKKFGKWMDSAIRIINHASKKFVV